VCGGALLIFGLYIARTTPDQFDQVLGLTLLLQMFAASTGFSQRAKRGHFDPVLAGADSRVAVAVAHAAISAMPGMLIWCACGLIDILTRPTHWPTAATIAGATAIFYVSAAAWASTLKLPRHAAGMLWVVLLFVLAAGRHIHVLQEVFLTDRATWTNALKVAGAAMMCPMFLVAYPSAPSTYSVAAVNAVTALMFLAGLRTIVRLDVTLSETS